MDMSAAEVVTTTIYLIHHGGKLKINIENIPTLKLETVKDGHNQEKIFLFLFKSSFLTGKITFANSTLSKGIPLTSEI